MYETKVLDLEKLGLVSGGDCDPSLVDGNTVVYLVGSSFFWTYEEALEFCKRSGITESAITKTTVAEMIGPL